MINIIKGTTKIGWQVQAHFKIGLHSKDIPLLEQIQSFFGGEGSINIESSRQAASYVVSDLNTIKDIIIPHFNIYPLESAKKVDYGLWKESVNLIATKKHLSNTGLEEIIAIKGALNLGLPDKLKENFPHIKPLDRPEFIVSQGPLNPNWVSGFVEGDGCFFVSIRSSGQIIAIISIGLNKRELPLLLKIMEFFGNKGSIGSYGAKTMVELKIASISDLNTFVLPHFDNYKLFGVKLHNYLIWRKMVILLTNKAHFTIEGRAELIELKSTLNKI